MRTLKFKFNQKVVGIGSDNKGLIGTVIGTNVSGPAWEVIVKVYDDSGVISFKHGRESTWEVMA